MLKSGEIIIFAQAMVEVESDFNVIENAIIEKFGEQKYLEFLDYMGVIFLCELLNGKFDLDDDGFEIDDWSDI